MLADDPVVVDYPMMGVQQLRFTGEKEQIIGRVLSKSGC